MQILHLQRILAPQFLEFLLDVLDDEVAHGIGGLRGDEPDGEFAGDFCWDDGFGAGSVEGAFNAMEGEGGFAHAAHEDGGFVGGEGDGGADGVFDVLDGVVKAVVESTGAES